MSENKNKLREEEFNITYLIEIPRTKEYPTEIADKLKKLNISFKVCKAYELKEEYDNDPDEILPLISIDLELYKKLKKISEIIGCSIEDIANDELTTAFESSMQGEPLILLDSLIGIKNIENPYSIVEKLKDVLNISDDYLEWLKTVDPIKYVENWKSPTRINFFYKK